MNKKTKEKRVNTVLKVILIVIVFALLVLIHLRNWQDIRGFERNLWHQVQSFCVNHRLLVIIVDTVFAILVWKHFKNKNESNESSND